MSKKKPIKIQYIQDCGTFPCDILISIGTTKEELIKFSSCRFNVPKEDIESEEFGIGKTIGLSGGQIILWLKKFDWSPQDISVLAHEIFHSAVFLFNNVGIKLEDSSDEAFAYQIDYLVRSILTKIKK